MGPVRGGLKRKRKTEKKVEASDSVSGLPDKEANLDWWDGFSKKLDGSCPSPSKSLDPFESFFKLPRKTFDYICSLVKEDMEAKSGSLSFNNGKPLYLHDQVAVALRRLSSGDSLVTVGDSFGVNHSTVSQVTWRFVESMEQRALHHLHWPVTESEMSQIKARFEKLHGLPNCCGVIDITHIMMCLPASDPTSDVWLDPEGNHSMVLQAIVGPDMKFLDIATGWPGKMKDRLVFESSNFFKLCDNEERLNRTGISDLPEGSGIREYIIGDLGFPLLPYLVRPYNGKEVMSSKVKANFNRRVLGTSEVAKRVLWRLKERWRIIRGVMWRPDRHKLPRIILVCCLLQNIVIDLNEKINDGVSLSCDNDNDDLDHDAGYGQEICEVVDVKGVFLRDKLSLYLSERLST